MEPAILRFERRARKVKRATSGKLLGALAGSPKGGDYPQFLYDVQFEVRICALRALLPAGRFRRLCQQGATVGQKIFHTAPQKSEPGRVGRSFLTTV
jgi:hypothetical protein